ncbi:MAG: hypothetical protein BroJett009_21680 [Armatimonadota bacterium]|nr:MAG: phage baseplate protein [Armatimonadota bacterium]GIK33176.1 MAG: hypothetical protein BroJett009_21680 [Armatimonadota bacterium]
MAERVKDFLGAGWKFPPRLDSRGRIELVRQEQDVEEAIKIILLTRKGERPMRPEFGSDLHRLVFDPNDATSAGMAKRFVMEALARWEPRIEVTDVEAWADEADPGRLVLSIHYQFLSTNSIRNLVFPYYVIPGEE